MIRARLTTPEDIADEAQQLPMYDYTALNAVATCPTWGITRYVAHKSPSADDTDREMALEAGQVMHQCLAAHALWQLRAEGYLDHFEHHSGKLFPDGNAARIFDGINGAESVGTQLRKITSRVIEVTGFYDDANDPKRSISVIEDTLAAYVDRCQWTEEPIWVRDGDDPTSDVGIEMKVDMIVDTGNNLLRYIGRLDRLQYTDDSFQRIKGVDFKTTSMNFTEAWDAGFMLSPQVTGYAVYAGLYTGKPVWNFDIVGLRLPVPAKSPWNGVKFLPLQRGEHHVEQWGQWIDTNMAMIDAHIEAPQHAPKFNHSCNRYFRPCALLHMCDGNREWRDEVYNEMGVKQWNPHD